MQAECGPDIEKYFHRDLRELSTIRQAAFSDGYPALTTEWETQAREKMKNLQNVDDAIAEIKHQHDAKRVDWESLLIRRWQAGDAEFFELLAIVRGAAIGEMGRLKRAAILYMRHIQADGLTPSNNSFLNWLRKTEGVDVINASRDHGTLHPVVHRESATRALQWAMGESEVGAH